MDTYRLRIWTREHVVGLLVACLLVLFAIPYVVLEMKEGRRAEERAGLWPSGQADEWRAWLAHLQPSMGPTRANIPHNATFESPVVIISQDSAESGLSLYSPDLAGIEAQDLVTARLFAVSPEETRTLVHFSVSEECTFIPGRKLGRGVTRCDGHLDAHGVAFLTMAPLVSSTWEYMYYKDITESGESKRAAAREEMESWVLSMTGFRAPRHPVGRAYLQWLMVAFVYA